MKIYLSKLDIKRTFLFLLLCILWLPVQSQGTDAAIGGQVFDETNLPLPGATVMVKNESTGFQTGTVTNLKGEYKIMQLPLGGPYTVTVSFVGYAKQVKTGYKLNQGNVLQIGFNMAEETSEISEVVVSGSLQKNQVARLGSSTAVGEDELNKLPTNGRNFSDLMAIAPTSQGINLGGQRGSSTDFTIDGMTSKSTLASGSVGRGPYTISMEAIREFQINTNVYDVTLGRSGGGTVSTVTKSGTNRFSGSAFVFERANWLSNPNDINQNKRSNNFTTTQYGLTLGGPIIKDKLHFFLAYDRQDSRNPFYIADIKNVDDEKTYRITQATLNEFVRIAREKYGMDPTTPAYGEFERKSAANSVFARIDWQINPTNVLTLRNNFNQFNNPTSDSDNTAINLYEVYANFRSMENSTMLSLRTAISPKLTNELKFQYQYSLAEETPNDLLPSQNIPRAIVERVASTIEDNVQYTSIQIGGQRYTPETQIGHTFHLVDILYFNTGKILYTFGMDNLLNYFDTNVTNEQNGRFFFNGLAAFESMTPYRYVREVPTGDPIVKQFILNSSVFGQMDFKASRDLDVMIGLRWDMTSYLTQPDYNPDVEKYLGYRTDAKVSDWKIQPRFQLTWDIGGKNTDIIRFGGGIFMANPVNYTQVNAIQNSGLNLAAVDVSVPAAGSTDSNLVPYPDFVKYRNDPSTAPGLEIFAAGAPKVSTINLNDPKLKMPTIYKANLSYNHFFGNWVRVGINLMYAHTANNYVYTDINMVDEPFFRLKNQGNRGVYVPASSITAQGNTNSVYGRKTDKVGRSLMLTNAGKLDALAATADVTVRLPKDGIINASYTVNDTRDNSSYNGNVANSSPLYRMIKDDVRDFSEMYYSDNQWRHKLVVYGLSPSFYGFTLSARYSGYAGTRYSLVISGDLNGDFVSSNDLAFVFDPSDPSTPSDIAVSMQKVLDNPDNMAIDYIKNSMGKIADRNGGVNGWYGQWDVRLSKDFNFGSQKIELTVDAFNFLNLLNKDWGRYKTLGNQTLLTITGFDQDTQQFNYRVNENCGVQSRYSGTPWQLQLGIKYIF